MMKPLSEPKGPYSGFYGISGTLVLGVFVFAAVFISVDAEAQDVDISGTAWVTDWPETRPDRASGEAVPDLDYSRYNLLPFIDSLAVHYRFSANSSSSERISMHFAVEWAEGQYGVVAGQKVELVDMPAGVVIKSIDLLMRVTVANEPVAEFFLPLDTIGLGPAPSMTFIDITNVEWSSLFKDVGEEEARQIFETGFRLSTVTIVRAVFAIETPDEYLIPVAEATAPSYDPLDKNVFIPDINVWIGWRDGRDRWIPPPGTVRKTGRNQPREMGRARLTGRARADRGLDRSKPRETARLPAETKSESGDEAASDEKSHVDRSARTQDEDKSQRARDPETKRGGGIDLGELFKPKNDDDDDDKDRLYPAAIAGVVAVAGLAIFGGTIGYFGSATKAPIGLMSGYVAPEGGMLLQVAINRQVFGKAKGPENVIASMTGFLNVFNSPIQPALGLGTRITEEGTDKTIFKPSVSVGFVGNFGKFVVLAGYDVTTPDFRFGIAVNLRHAE